MKVAIIILAAGGSNRLGQPKQLLQVNGKPFLQHLVQLAIGLKAGPVVVVLGANASMLQPFCTGAEIVVNEQWRNGIAGSISKAVDNIQHQHPEAEGCILSVCDQPHLSGEIFTRLITRHQGTGMPIIASAYDAQTFGTPAFFHQNMYSRLLQLTDDQGAKIIMQQLPEKTALVPFADGKIDIDTPEDYANWMQQQAQQQQA